MRYVSKCIPKQMRLQPLPEIVGTERRVSEVVRPSDRRRRTPDGRACCDDVVIRRDGGSWKIEIADDWQHPTWGGSSSRGTVEPCLGDTGELSLRAYGGSAAELRATRSVCPTRICIVSKRVKISS